MFCFTLLVYFQFKNVIICCIICLTKQLKIDIYEFYNLHELNLSKHLQFDNFSWLILLCISCIRFWTWYIKHFLRSWTQLGHILSPDGKLDDTVMSYSIYDPTSKKISCLLIFNNNSEGWNTLRKNVRTYFWI